MTTERSRIGCAGGRDLTHQNFFNQILTKSSIHLFSLHDLRLSLKRLAESRHSCELFFPGQLNGAIGRTDFMAVVLA
jgi:hypothetical protein